jgi:hypothetical protein
MTSFVIKDVRAHYEEFDVTGILNSLNIDYKADVEDATNFADTSRRRIPGLKDTNVNYSGFWSAAEDAGFFAKIGASTPGIFSFAKSNVIGARAFTLQNDLSSYSFGGEIGSVHPFSIASMGNGPLVKGELFADSVEIASDVSAILEIGDVAADEAVFAALHVVNSGGDASQTLDVIVESDDLVGFGSPLTRLTFPQVTTSPIAQWQFLAGLNTDTFWRVSWTIAGTGSPTFTIFVVVGIVKI